MTATQNTRLLDIVERRGPHAAFAVKRRGAWQEHSFEWAFENALKLKRRVLLARYAGLIDSMYVQA